MKQQILNLKKKLLLVEIDGKLSDEFVQVIDEYGTAEILGKLTDITESQFEEWVKQNDELSVAGFGFEDYNGASICDTAKESFFSYLENEGIVFENKLGEKPSQFSSHCREEEWQEAESKVWQLSQTYLFEILK